MISMWIFTKGFSCGPTGVFEWNLSRKGRYETYESFWRKCQWISSWALHLLSNQPKSQEVSPSFFICLCLLGNFTSNLSSHTLGSAASSFIMIFLGLFLSAAAVFWNLKHKSKTLQWSALNPGWCELCHHSPLNASPACQTMEICLAMP